MMRRPWIAPLAFALLALAPTPAFADLTGFVGLHTSPERQALRGLAVGASLVIVGVEFELAQAGEDESEGVPSLLTVSGNVFVQTPVPVFGTRLYLTTGTGVYRERVEAIDHGETNLVFNTGGGAKITLIGPLRVRIDYRVLKLRGDTRRPSTVQRIYAGLNLGF